MSKDKMIRTQHLMDLIALHKPRVITEIGVAKGATAVHMITEAARHVKEIEYHGFDLFESLDDDLRTREFQNKEPGTVEQFCKAFDGLAEALAEKGIALTWYLHKGPTTETLHSPEAEPARKADLVYLDGGHSVETIEHDLTALAEAKIIVLDDYYHDRPADFLLKYGCNIVIEKLRPRNYGFLPLVETKPGADGIPIAVGQVVTPRSAWPWLRMQAGLTMIRALKPKRVFGYTDANSMKYLKQVVKDNGGVVGIDPKDGQYDLAYVDCCRMLPDGKTIFMDADEAKEAWRDVHAPVKVFAGLVQERPEIGAGACIPEGALVVSNLDLIEGEEVGAFVYPKEAWPNRTQVHVASRNCVDDEIIIENVKANWPRMPAWIELCKPHNKRCIFVSAGPSLESEFDDIRREQAAGGYVVCVKHAHDKLIAAGIIPWGCVLLDPRDHVSQFIQNPHPGTIYFTASMCSKTTLDLLLEKNARVVGYNALVGAGEDKIMPNGTRFLVGGTSAATRGLPLLLSLGFRDFVLRAYDSCYNEKPANVGEKTKLGYDRFIKVEVGGRKFWTELELVAQAQDFKAFVDTLTQTEMTSNVKLEVPGDGLIPHIWNLMKPYRPEFKEVAKAW